MKTETVLIAAAVLAAGYALWQFSRRVMPDARTYYAGGPGSPITGDAGGQRPYTASEGADWWA